MATPEATTPLDLITLAFKTAGVVGVGQTPLAEDTNDAFVSLNMMWAQWNRKRPLVYHLLDKFVVGTGAQTYTVGPAGDFNISPRPARIESAFVRLLNQANPYRVDYQLAVIEAYEDYATIVQKRQASFPQCVFLDTGYPTGTLYVWPLASDQYEIHLILQSPLAQFTSLTETIIIPEEYKEAIIYNLSLRLFALFKTPPDPTIAALAKASLATIMNANTQVEVQALDPVLVATGIYNIYSDSYTR